RSVQKPPSIRRSPASGYICFSARGCPPARLAATPTAAPPGSNSSWRSSAQAPQSPSPPPVRWSRCPRTPRETASPECPAALAVLSYPRETLPYDRSPPRVEPPAPAQSHEWFLSWSVHLRTDVLRPSFTPCGCTQKKLQEY